MYRPSGRKDRDKLLLPERIFRLTELMVLPVISKTLISAFEDSAPSKFNVKSPLQGLGKIEKTPPDNGLALVIDPNATSPIKYVCSPAANPLTPKLGNTDSLL